MITKILKIQPQKRYRNLALALPTLSPKHSSPLKVSCMITKILRVQPKKRHRNLAIALPTPSPKHFKPSKSQLHVKGSPLTPQWLVMQQLQQKLSQIEDRKQLQYSIKHDPSPLKHYVKHKNATQQNSSTFNYKYNRKDKFYINFFLYLICPK